jgi:hypothetical protein
MTVASVASRFETYFALGNQNDRNSTNDKNDTKYPKAEIYKDYKFKFAMWVIT